MTRMESQQIKSKGGSPEEHPDRPPQSYCIVFCIIMVTTSDTQGDVFKDNQTVRVIDQIANDIAVLFNTKYLGVVPNDAAGRTSLWSDIVQHHEQLEEIRAIEDFADSDVVVEQGNTKKSVVVTDAVTVVNAMSKLYMTVTVA